MTVATLDEARPTSGPSRPVRDPPVVDHHSHHPSHTTKETTMSTTMATETRHENTVHPVHPQHPHHVRRVSIVDRAALHLGVALIKWGRRPGTPAHERRANRVDRALLTHAHRQNIVASGFTPLR
jgi:hypothetical protein